MITFDELTQRIKDRNNEKANSVVDEKIVEQVMRCFYKKIGQTEEPIWKTLEQIKQDLPAVESDTVKSIVKGFFLCGILQMDLRGTRAKRYKLTPLGIRITKPHL